ncbi:MAG: hypothetical protein ACOC5T_04990 [Elusimicrobiota bacterium]
MVDLSTKPNKRERNKAKRDAEKKARKEKNKTKVAQSKVEKKKKKAEQIQKVEKPVEPKIHKVRDVWQTLDLEKQGITVHEDGTYDPDEHKKQTNSNSKKKPKKAKHPEWRRSRGHGRMGRVCVITKNGDHVRVNRKVAHKLVSDGGKYIPKWQFKGKVNGEEVDWSNKK